jgi:predicted dinucleotide-binding enzyme
MTKIAVVGSGEVGEALANGFLAHGHDVMRGSREPGKLEDWKKKAGGKAQIGNFAECGKFAQTVVLAVKGAAAESAIEQIGVGNLDGKTVIDTTNPISGPPVDGVLPLFTTPNDSLMETLQKKAPRAHFVKAFNSVGSAQMVNPNLEGGPPTMFICGDDAGAKRDVAALLTSFGWETADMGTARSARAIEPLCVLWCVLGFTQNSWMHAFKLLRPAK